MLGLLALENLMCGIKPPPGLVFLLTFAVFSVIPHGAFCQGTGGPIVTDSKAGYIDNAIPGNVFRARYDSSYKNVRPNRAEWFYAKGAPGPGLPFPEISVDYQDISAYGEFLVLPRLSTFLDIPTRFLNPEVNANAGGLADLNGGFKYAFRETDIDVFSFQGRVYVPSGNATRGLGTNHVSLEPALLYYQALNERLGVEAEFRYWVPIGGTNFAGQVIRYGVGGYYTVHQQEKWSLSPVVEFVGWTVLNGKESVVQPPAPMEVVDAAGNTIINAKIGVRMGLGERADFYAGWGRALTSDTWYSNTLRLEMRFLY